MNEVKEYILSNQITLVITSPNSRTLSIINLINELSIKEKYKTILFSLNISCNYYLQKLISFLSGINNRLITKYFTHIQCLVSITETKLIVIDFLTQ